MPNFQGSDWLILQPYDEKTREFEITKDSAAGANDGHLAYGDGVASYTIRIDDENGDDKTTEIKVSDSETADIITVKLKYPATSGAGKYDLCFKVITDNSDKVELNFNRIRAVDL